MRQGAPPTGSPAATGRSGHLVPFDAPVAVALVVGAFLVWPQQVLGQGPGQTVLILAQCVAYAIVTSWLETRTRRSDAAVSLVGLATLAAVAVLGLQLAGIAGPTEALSYLPVAALAAWIAPVAGRMVGPLRGAGRWIGGLAGLGALAFGGTVAATGSATTAAASVLALLVVPAVFILLPGWALLAGSMGLLVAGPAPERAPPPLDQAPPAI